MSDILLCGLSHNGCHKPSSHQHGKECDRSCYICHGGKDHTHEPKKHKDGLEPWCDWCGLSRHYREPEDLNRHIHSTVVHHDGLPPWCEYCGLTAGFREPSLLAREDMVVYEKPSYVAFERKLPVYLPSTEESPDVYVGKAATMIHQDSVIFKSTPFAEFAWQGTVSEYPIVYRSKLKVKSKVVDAHIHHTVQHEDGLPPWCDECGLTAGYREPHRVMGLSVKPVILTGKKLPVYLPDLEGGEPILIGDKVGHGKNERIVIKTNSPLARALRSGTMTGRDIIKRPVVTSEGEKEMAGKNDRMGNVMLEGVRIGFRNFSGKEGQYNREGDRNFAVFLDPDIAEQMKHDGWNVKQLRPREEGDQPQDYIQVAVSYKGRPPRITMITSRGRTPLGEGEVDILDWASIDNVDLIIRPYEWAVSGKTGVKAYLQTIFVTIEEDELERKYADVPDSAQNAIGGGEERLALEGGKFEDLGEYQG